MINKCKFSIVSPIYKAEKIVPELVKRIVSNITKITNDYEIILVCDGSPDNSWLAIKNECALNKHVIGINLSRNFGQHYALSAGLKKASGEWVIVMDCDLQDRPEEFSTLYNEVINKNLDYVVAKRVSRKDNFLKRMSSLVFNSIYEWLSGIHTDRSLANYGIYNHKVIKAFNSMIDTSRSWQSLLSYVGFKHGVVEVEHSSRFEGKSSYSWKRLYKLSMDIILSNSNKPLKFAINIGGIITLISLVMIVYNLITFLIDDVLPGFSSTMISIWFVGGVNVFLIGVIGLYIDKIFNQVKSRPLYIISEILNGKD